MKMVTEVDGECGNFKEQLGVVDVDRSVLPDSIVIHVPQVYAVSTSVIR